MELKNYKRVSTGSEFRDVVQTANDEPRFRANGHELQFDSANSDYLSFPSATLLDGESFIWEGSLTDTGGYNILFASSTIDWFGVAEGFCRLSINNVGANFNDSDLTENASYVKVELSRVGDDYFVNVNNKGANLILTSIDLFSATNIGWRTGSGSYSTINVFSFELLNETFNPTDIDSNAQIVGSSGTVATVNTSHASGNSYVLGTVFQKSSFALAFDSANQEYVNIPNPNWATFGDVDIEVNLTNWNQTETYHSIFSYEVSTANSINLWVRNNGVIYFTLRIGNTTIFDVNTAITYSDLGRFSLKNGVLNFNDSVLFDQSVNNSQVLNSSTWKLNIAKRESQSIYFGDYDLLDAKANGVNYPLTEGLGNTTNGATINTSHADGIKRINFGQWLKGNDIDGWTPYTIV